MTKKRSKVDSKPIAGVYPYTNKDGKTLYRVVFRYLSKDGTIKQSQRRKIQTIQEANELRRTKDKELEQAQTPIDDQITLGAYLDIWQDKYVVDKLKPTTVDGYLNNIRRLKKHLGHIKLCRLTYSHITNFYDRLRKPPKDDKDPEPLALNSVKYIQRVLHKALKDAIREKLIRDNPSDDIKLSGNSDFVYLVLSKDEAKLLHQAVKGTLLYVPVSLALMIGLRRGEVMGLRWADINFETGIISIRTTHVCTSKGIVAQSPKTKHGIRDIPASKFLIEILKQEKNNQERNKFLLGNDYHDDDLICCKANGVRYTPGYILRKLQKTLKELSLPQIRFHDLRHTFATLAMEQNVPMKVVSNILGHSTIAITANIYSHVSDTIARKHSERVASLLDD